MPSDKRISDPDGWARLRFAIIGPLLADPPPPGELGARLKALAARDWRHPVTGLPLRFGFGTLERWYSAQSKIMRSEKVPDQHRQAIGRRSTAHNRGRGYSLVSSAISASGGRKSPLRRLSGLSGLIASSICVGSARKYISVVCTLAWPSQSATLRISPVA
jgi:hypothetical protein